MRIVHSNATEVHRSPAKLSKYADKNAVATSWMMAQARGHMDVPSEPLGDFYWSMRQVTNACNFARGVLAAGENNSKEDRTSSPPWSGVG